MAMPIQLVFESQDPARLATFWAEALGYQMQPPPDGFASWPAFLSAQGIPEERWNDAAAIVDPKGREPRLYFQRAAVAGPKRERNRLRIDISVSGEHELPHEVRKERVLAEVERLKTLGATDESGTIEQLGEIWVRMLDPEGNELCVQ